MKIKLKNRETGDVIEFDSNDMDVSLQMSEIELEQIKSMPKGIDGKSPSGRSFRTFGIIDEKSDESWCFK